MTTMNDAGIIALYILAQQEDGAGITDNQRLAVEQLKRLSALGNPDADVALHLLKQVPGIHPFLKEVLIT
jgi:hypothetical protein